MEDDGQMVDTDLILAPASSLARHVNLGMNLFYRNHFSRDGVIE